MHRLTPVCLLALASFAWAQDPTADPESEADPEPAAQEQTEVDPEPGEEADNSDLDTESYVDSDDDDFRPSEDIPADQSIPFPTDI